MKNIKSFAQRLWNDESGQGMAEYVLLIVVIVGVAMIFKDRIRNMVSQKMGSVSDQFNQFDSGGAQ